MFVLAGVVVAVAFAVWYVRPRSTSEFLATVVLALATLGFASWLFGQGDERPVVIPIAGGLTGLCLWGLYRAHTRARWRSRTH